MDHKEQVSSRSRDPYPPKPGGRPRLGHSFSRPLRLSRGGRRARAHRSHARLCAPGGDPRRHVWSSLPPPTSHARIRVLFFLLWRQSHIRLGGPGRPFSRSQRVFFSSSERGLRWAPEQVGGGGRLIGAIAINVASPRAGLVRDHRLRLATQATILDVVGRQSIGSGPASTRRRCASHPASPRTTAGCAGGR